MTNLLVAKYKKPTIELVRDYGAEFKIVRDALVERFSKRSKRVREGRNRTTFLFAGYVVKIPRNLSGVADNDWEGSISNGPLPKQDLYAVNYPKTRIIYFQDVPVLFMERVIPVTSKRIKRRIGKVPKWIDRIDCGQVGFNKKGVLVAYDYGPR